MAIQPCPMAVRPCGSRKWLYGLVTWPHGHGGVKERLYGHGVGEIGVTTCQIAIRPWQRVNLAVRHLLVAVRPLSILDGRVGACQGHDKSSARCVKFLTRRVKSQERCNKAWHEEGKTSQGVDGKGNESQVMAWRGQSESRHGAARVRRIKCLEKDIKGSWQHTSHSITQQGSQRCTTRLTMMHGKAHGDARPMEVHGKANGDQ